MKVTKRTIAIQKQEDQKLTNQGFSGGAYDLVNKSFAVWVNGTIVGWANSMNEAYASATAQKVA